MRGHLLPFHWISSSRRVALLAVLATLHAGCGSSDDPPVEPDAGPVCEPSTLPEGVLPAGVHIEFPPAQSLTEADTIIVRGTAKLDGGVAAIRVNGVTAQSLDGFAHWLVPLPLVPGENTITVESEDGAGQVEPAAAQATIVSAPYPMFNPVAVVLDAPRNRALVLENHHSTVLAVDLTTGLRTLVYEHPVDPFAHTVAAPSVPPPGAFPLLDMIALDDERVLVAEYDELFTVNVATGERTVVSGPEVGSGPEIEGVFSMALDAERGRVLALELFRPALLAVDPATGVRSVVADFAADGEFDGIIYTGLAVDEQAGRALVIMKIDSKTPALMAVDLATGALTQLSGEGQGSGPALMEPEDMVLDAANGRVLLADGRQQAVIAIDLVTGDRTILWDTATTGGPMLQPTAMTMDAPQGRALIVDRNRRSLHGMDLATGQLTRISDDVIGSGDGLSWPISIAMDAPAGRVLVGDSGGSALVAVDLATGARVVLSSDAVGDGPSLGAPTSVALDRRSQRVLVANLDGVLVAVDLATGQRSTLASVDDGREPRFSRLDAIAIDEAGNRAITSTDADQIVAVDLATGDRTVLATSVNYVTWHGMQPECNRMFLATFAGGSQGLLAMDLSSGRLETVVRYESCPVPTETLEYPAYDPRTARVLGWRYDSASLVTMDTRTGACTGLGGIALDGLGPPAGWPGEMVVDPSTGLLLMVGRDSRALLAIDAETNQRVIVSR